LLHSFLVHFFSFIQDSDQQYDSVNDVLPKSSNNKQQTFENIVASAVNNKNDQYSNVSDVHQRKGEDD
jgi:hypothetical protein